MGYGLIEQGGDLIRFAQVALYRQSLTAGILDRLYRGFGVRLGAVAVIVHHHLGSAFRHLAADQATQVLGAGADHGHFVLQSLRGHIRCLLYWTLAAYVMWCIPESRAGKVTILVEVNYLYSRDHASFLDSTVLAKRTMSITAISMQPGEEVMQSTWRIFGI